MAAGPHGLQGYIKGPGGLVEQKKMGGVNNVWPYVWGPLRDPLGGFV